jgi:polysaccharide export outer membrane protein
MAQYRLSAGDVIEVAVAGVPELRQRVTVQLDGSISLPLLGTLVVAGSSASEARAKIQSALATKVFRQRTPDGRERLLVIEFDEVAATVVEYRPIYVSGNVTKPGEQAYRPSMTVRQAVAGAGGFDSSRFRPSGTLRETIELQSDYVAHWTAFAKEQIHLWRIRSELGEKSDLDQKVMKEVPLPKSTLAEMIKVEGELLRSRAQEHEQEKAHLHRALAQAAEHMEILGEQLKKEEQGVEADSQDLQRIGELLAKGAVANPRVSEARRALLLSSTRMLQTQAQLMQTTRQRGEYARQLDKLDEQRKIMLLRDLQEVSLKVSGLRAKLQAIGEKLQVNAGSLVTGEAGTTPEITVIRKGENGGQRFRVGVDAELQPGDVVEVALRGDQLDVAPQ